MPDQNSTQVVLSDELGDLNLDDVFGEPSGTQTTVETQPSAAAPEPVAPPVTNGPVIKTKTGTVYKTLQDAEEGIEHKDALIAQLRQQLQQQTGKDPLTPPTRQQQEQPINYMEQQDKYFEDIADAVATKNTKKYMETQQKLVYDSLGPIAPTLIALSKANAEQTVANQIPEFKNFLRSEDFTQTLSDSPLLAEAIQNAENNPAAAQQLPELYRLAYLTSQGRRLPQLIQSVEAQRVAAPPVPRPTVHSTPVPPPAHNAVAAQPSLQTAEGRRALIQAMEGRGVGDLKF